MNLSRNYGSIVDALAPHLAEPRGSAELGQVAPRPRLTARVRRGLLALGIQPTAAKDLVAARAWLTAHGL